MRLFPLIIAIALQQVCLLASNEEINKDLVDIGKSAAIDTSSVRYDTFVSTYEAEVARKVLEEVFKRYALTSIGFEIGSVTDILTLLKVSEEDSSSMRCKKCQRIFASSSYLNYHMMRDHLVVQLHREQRENKLNQYILIDKLCRFIDCSRERNQDTTQTVRAHQKRLSECIYFMARNVKFAVQAEGNDISDSNSNDKLTLRQIRDICEDITGNNTEHFAPEAITQTARYYIWKIILVVFLLMSASYYVILLLSEEGRRAWLAPLKH